MEIKRQMDKVNQPVVEKHGKIISKRKDGTVRVATFFNEEYEPSLAHQEFKDECDVNKIMGKFSDEQQRRILASPVQSGSGVYGDFTQIPNYQEMLHTLRDADRMFEELPSKVRGQFNNNPHELINWLKDPKNKDQAIEMGLMVKPEEKPVDPILTELQSMNSNLKKSQKKVALPQDE